MFIRGIRQVDLAESSGIDKSKICSYLKGRYKPNAEAMSKLAKALRVTPEWLIGEGDDDLAKMAREEYFIPDIKTTLSEDEMTLIEKYRAADETKRQIVRLTLGL